MVSFDIPLLAIFAVPFPSPLPLPKPLPLHPPNSSLLILPQNHAVLVTVGFGILMPLGFLFSRHFRVIPGADPAWFFLHIVLMVVGWLLGIIGFGYGIQLYEWSTNVKQAHFELGIAVVVTATLQVSGCSEPRHSLRTCRCHVGAAGSSRTSVTGIVWVAYQRDFDVAARFRAS